jgi:GNAT superfamily N-acetyltransferase
VPSELNEGSLLRATSDDLPAVYGLLEECSAWLRDRAIPQWNPVYPFERFAREVNEGHVWHLRSQGASVATVTLLEQRPEYYPHRIWNDGLDAWYVCRLAVGRRLVGAGIGSKLLAQIEAAAALAGRRALRLDVSAANPFLEGYYVARGYRRVTVAEIGGSSSIFLAKAVQA